MTIALDEERLALDGAGARVRSLDWASLAFWLGLALLPVFAGRFVLTEVVGLGLVFGLIALSLQFLAGFGGMVNIAQMTIAGIAAYMVAILGPNTMSFGLGWPIWVATPLAILIATIAAGLIGLLAIRTAGIYTIMITLAIAAAFYYLTFQNYEIFNGYNGINGVAPPVVFGVDFAEPVPLYYLLLAVAGLAYWAAVYAARSTFGLALQGIRDNARRMEAIGFNVPAHRVAAYVATGAVAAVGGVLLVWHNGRVSPGTVGVSAAIDILIIAVIGGMRHPIGPFIGAMIFAMLSTFAMDIIEVVVSRDRFKLVIGLGFLALVLFSSDGVLGLWQALRRRAARQRENWK